MILVIIIIAIVLTIIPIISFQNITQIKSNVKNESNLKYRYSAEAGIEKTIAKVCRKIEDVLNNYEENKNYTIGVSRESYQIDNEFFCIVEEINKDISINKKKLNVLEIDEFIIEIISTSIKKTQQDEYYEINCTVKITNDFIDDKYIVNYQILSYEKI